MKKIQPNFDKIKIGDTYWSCYAWDENGICHVDLDLWKVRTIRRSSRKVGPLKRISSSSPYVYIVQVNEFTWVKKKGKMTWAPVISDVFRSKFSIKGPLPFHVFTTRLQALRHQRDCLEKSIQYQQHLIAQKRNVCEEDIKELNINKRLISLVKGRITRERRK